MDSTSTSPDADKVAALRAIGRQRGYSEDEITQKLTQAGLLQAPQGPGLGQQMGHAAGLIGRMAVQGVGNMASMPFGVAGSAYQAVTGNQPPAILQGNQGTAAANQLGLPEPQGAGERIATAAGENIAGSAILPGATAGMAALGGAAGAASQGAGEMGASPLGQAAAGLAVGAGAPIVGSIVPWAIRSAIAGASSRRLAAQQSLALIQAGDPNAAVSLGQVAQGGVGRTLQGGIKSVPGAMQTLQRTNETQAGQMGTRLTGIADQIGPGGSAEFAGAAVRRGIEQGFIPRFKATADQLYNKAFSYLQPSDPIPLSATLNLHAQMENLAASARPLSDQIANPKVASILEATAQASQQNPNGVPFEVVKAIRSRLGAMLSGDELVSDVNLGDVKRIYGALSTDIESALAQKGPEALQAWGRASSFYQAGMNRIEKVLQPLIDKNVPERLWGALTGGTRDGATVLRSTMRSLDPIEQRLVSSTLLRRLGDAGDGVFHPEGFLRAYQKLSPEARTAAFGGFGPDIPTSLDKLSKAIELRKAASNVMPNPSGTAANTAFMAILSSLGAASGAAVGGAPMATVGSLLGPVGAGVTSKLLAETVFTNPRMIQWLVKQTTVPFGAMAQQAALLAKDSQKWAPEDREVALDLSQHLTHTDWTQVMMASALADATAGPSGP